MRQLLARGANPHAGVGGKTPLFIAISGKDLATIELLIDYGALLAPDEGFELTFSIDDATFLQFC